MPAGQRGGLPTHQVGGSSEQGRGSRGTAGHQHGGPELPDGSRGQPAQAADNE